MSVRFTGGSATTRLSLVGLGSPALPFTVGCWAKFTTFATGRLITGSGTTFSTLCGLQTGAATAQRFGLKQINATTNMVCEVAAGTTGIWQCVVAVCSDNITAANNVIFTGLLATAMSAQTHVADTNGVGAATAPNSGSNVGKSGTATTAIDADVCDAFIVPWSMTVDEAERFRQGDRAVLFAHGLPSYYVPMRGGTNALREMGGAVQNWTNTGSAAVSEDPPIFTGWGGRGGLHVQRRPNIQTPQSVSGALTPAGTAAKQTAKLPGGAVTPGGAEARSTLKVAAGALTPAATLARLVSKAPAGALTPSGTLTAQKVAVRSVSGGITPAGTLTRGSVYSRTLTGAFT